MSRNKDSLQEFSTSDRRESEVLEDFPTNNDRQETVISDLVCSAQNRKIFRLAECGSVEKMLELLRGEFADSVPIAKLDPSFEITPEQVTLEDPSVVMPLQVLCVSINKIHSEKKNSKVAMANKMVEPFKGVFNFYVERIKFYEKKCAAKNDIDTSKYFLYHLRLKLALKSAKEYFKNMQQAWGKDDPNFSKIMKHLLDACSSVGIADNTAKVVKKLSSVDIGCCLFPFLKRKKRVLPEEIVSVTHKAANTMTPSNSNSSADTRFSSGSDSDISGPQSGSVPKP